MAVMEDKSTSIEKDDFHFEGDIYKERWKKEDEQEDIMKDKSKLLLIIFSILVLLSLLATATILAWAYIERNQNAIDRAQLHEPTRLYSSTSASGTMGQLVNSTRFINGNEKMDDEQAQRSSIPSNDKMHLIRVYDGIRTGAVCLDGTPPAYYLRPGKGLGANRWILHFNGGAWCFDEKSCLERSRGSLGSTKHLPPSPPVIQGINSPNEQVNPDFYDWNLVWIVYCDGASFTGDREEPVVVQGENIFFRGKRVLDAVIEDLLKHGIHNAEGIILTGSSAGSMTAMFAVDRLAERLPNVPMHVLSDAGYFIETQMMGGKSVGALFKKIYEMQNSSSGLNTDCIRGIGAQKGWRCFLPQHTFRFIKHPVFILNAAYDVWALLYFVGIDCKFPVVSQPSIQKKSSVESQDNTQQVGNHRAIRDVSGFEIQPYFRKKIETGKEQLSDDAIKNEFTSASNVRKDGIPQKVVEPATNPEKRNFEPQLGDSDLVDSLNTFSLNDIADNYYNERISNPRVSSESTEGTKLHLNIDHETPGDDSKGAGDAPQGGEFLSPPVLQNGILANNKEEDLTLNPLANSVSTLTNVAENVKQDNMDTETIGLLNEVFKKLKKMMPKKGKNATMVNKKNATMTELLKVAGVKPGVIPGAIMGANILKNEKQQINKDNKGLNNLENKVGNKTNQENAPKDAIKEAEKMKTKEITAKLNDMLKVKQAEILKSKKLQSDEAKKQAQRTSSEIIASMFKKVGKLPNFLNSNANHPVPLQNRFPQNSVGLHRNDIVENKNKRSTNIIREYINILRSDPPECTENQMINVMKYRNAMLKATAVVRSTPNSGMFLLSCIQHSMSLFDETWTGVTIQQKSIQQAFGDWYYGRQTKHIHIDGVYPTNPSCP